MLKNDIEFNSNLLFEEYSPFFKGVEYAQALLDYGGIDINSKNENGETLLILASKKGMFDLVKLLVERGANLNAVDNGYIKSYLEYFAGDIYSHKHSWRLNAYGIAALQKHNLEESRAHFSRSLRTRSYTTAADEGEFEEYEQKIEQYQKIMDFLSAKGADTNLPFNY